MKFIRTLDGETGLIARSGSDAAVALLGRNIPAFATTQPGHAAAIEAALPSGVAGSWNQMIDRWEDVRGAFQAFVDAAEAQAEGLELQPLTETPLGPPLPNADGRVFAVGANFAPHAAHSQAAIEGTEGDSEDREVAIIKAKREGLPPWGFSLLPGTFVGPEGDITPPEGTQKLDYEAEVALIFRATGTRRGRDVVPWGFTAWNDLSIRDPHFGIGIQVDHGPMTWTLQKNFDTSNACGPCVVVDEAADPNNVAFSSHVNGEERQRGNTADMVYSFDDVIDHISTYLSMRSGDVVVSGTCAGTAMESGVDGPYLRDGDTVVVEVEAVGVLRNRIVLPSGTDSEMTKQKLEAR